MVGLLLLAGVALSGLLRGEPTTVIRVEPVFAEQDVRALAADAETIAILRPTGSTDVHWNSADGQPWTAESLAHGAWIYRDDEMEVVRTIRGVLPDTIVVRGVGGKVGNVEMVYEGQPEWRAGQSYLVLLRQEQTPTREGFELHWTVPFHDLGVFESVGPDAWVNQRTDKTLVEADL